MRHKSTKERINFPFQYGTYLTCIASILLSWLSTFKVAVFSIQLLTMVLQFYNEGGKPYTPLQAAIFICNILQFWWAQFLFTTILTFSLVRYQFYHIKIIDQGHFDFGYRQVSLHSRKLGIFYPTSQKGQPAKWIQTKDCYKNMCDFIFMNSLQIRWVPFKTFQACSYYMNRITMPAYICVRLEAPNLGFNEFQFIIFSHGLSLHVNSYSSYCSWLASQGYIVMSVNHPKDFFRVVYDQQFLKWKEYFKKMIYLIGNEGFKARTDEIEHVYTSLISQELLRCVFPQFETINIKKVHFCGHSYGGATCIETISKLNAKKVDLSLVGHVLTIDPYYYSLSESTLEHSFDQNITVINSATSMNILPPELGIKRLFRTIIENSPQKLCLLS